MWRHGPACLSRRTPAAPPPPAPPRLAGGAASAWLGLRLQLLAGGLVGCVGLASLASASRLPLPRWAAPLGSLGDSGAGGGSASLQSGPGGPWSAAAPGSGLAASLAGLGLAYALPVVGLLSGLLTSTAETEQARAGGRAGAARKGRCARLLGAEPVKTCVKPRWPWLAAGHGCGGAVAAGERWQGEGLYGMIWYDVV